MFLFITNDEAREKYSSFSAHRNNNFIRAYKQSSILRSESKKKNGHIVTKRVFFYVFLIGRNIFLDSERSEVYENKKTS